MIRELQSRFIKTTMLVVTLLLVLFLTALNVLNGFLSVRESRSTLSRIAEENLAVLAPGEGDVLPRRGDGPGEDFLSQDSTDYYFCARVAEDGTLAALDLTHAGALTQAQAVVLLNRIHADFTPTVTAETEAEETDRKERALPQINGPVSDRKGSGTDRHAARQILQKKRGRTGSYMYYVGQRDDRSLLYVFLDVGAENSSLVRILAVTAALGAVLWALVFLLVLLLSKKAIRPIAENLERQKQFITNAGHEIKTPLAVIVSNVDVQELHEGRTKWLENIRAQALRLSDLTRQMLTLAKMDEAGTGSFPSTTFDASEELEETVRVFRESAALRGMQVRTDIAQGVQLHFSREQYRQMLELLLDNAVKYGREGTALTISLQQERKGLRIEIGNDCEQLPDCAPDKLFDRFYRSDASRSRSTGGSGIGLAVVRAIAQSAGGSAVCRYGPETHITFEVCLPRGSR